MYFYAPHRCSAQRGQEKKNDIRFPGAGVTDRLLATVWLLGIEPGSFARAAANS